MTESQGYWIKRMRRRQFLGAIALGTVGTALVAACGGSKSTSPPLPPSDASPETAAQPGVDTPTLDNLIDGGGWDCLRGGSVANGKATIKAGDSFQTLVNDYSFHFATQGDFTIAATIEA